jgi:phospholipid/cholesterol/gamma-HCH transport system substrate-binding protein
MSEEETEAPKKSRLLEVKAGAFVVLVLLIGLGTVMILSEKQHVFEHEVVFHAAFIEIQGLKEGAPVRVAGVNVGSVSRIDFIARDGKPLVEVDLKIARAGSVHVRADSIARIDAQGLLGDKLIEISAGSPSQAVVPAGATLPTTVPADFDKMLRQAGETIERAKTVADKAAAALDAIADPKLVDDLHASMSSLRALMAATEKGEGLAHAIFYDRGTTRQFQALTARVNLLVGHVDDGVAKLDNILDATDDRGRQIVNNLSGAAKSLGDTLGDVRRAQIIHNLDHASADLAYLTAYTKEGKGSLGGAIIDPVAYQQLVTILGGVSRSRVLRALVRYAITQDDGQGTARVVDGPRPKK